MFADRGVGIGEDHALPAQIVLERAVHDFAFELGLHAGQELLLSFGNAEPVEGLLDFLGHVLPGFALVVGRLEVVVDILEIDVDASAPARHRLGVEDLQALETKVAHPGGLALHLGNLRDDFGIQTLPRLENGFRVGAEVVLVDLADLRFCNSISCHDRIAFVGLLVLSR